MTPSDPLPIEFLDPMVVKILRGKTPAEKFQQLRETSRFVRTMVAAGIRHQYPDWTEDEVQAELARRTLRGSD